MCNAKLSFKQDKPCSIKPIHGIAVLAGAFEVYCELDPLRHDGTTEAGWTVFQRRVDDTIDFYRSDKEIHTLNIHA